MDSQTVNCTSYIPFTVLGCTLGSAHCFSLLKLVWKLCLHVIFFSPSILILLGKILPEMLLNMISTSDKIRKCFVVW